VRDALVIVKDAVTRSFDEDVRSELLFQARDYLEARAVTCAPLSNFRRAIEPIASAGQRLVGRATIIRLACGLVVGVLLSRAGGALVSAQLFGVAPNDGFSLLVAAVALSVVVALATVRPLVRAMLIDPMIALRTE
jgi:hypothetical protein